MNIQAILASEDDQYSQIVIDYGGRSEEEHVIQNERCIHCYA